MEYQLANEKLLCCSPFFPQWKQWISVVQYHFWAISVMDYRLLISEARLGFSQSVRDTELQKDPTTITTPPLRQKETAPLVTLSCLITHSAFLPSDCQCLRQLFMLTEAYPKDTAQNKKRGKRMEFWLCKRYPETSVLPGQISKWHGGEKDLSMSRYILNATQKKIIVILFLQSWNTSTESF